MNQKLHFVLAAAAICLNLGFAKAQAPNLGAANSFGLFTATGAIDNIGNTVITGDAGTNIGAFNGFPPAIVVGQIHIADPVSAQAAIDVNTAYSELVAKTCGAVLGTGMGGGQLLTPGTYCIGGATTLNGELTFDAQGDPNVLFFIQIDGALSTGLASHVVLLNSASPCNIYWQVNGGVSFGDNSIFEGIALANGQLILLNGATVNGKALAIQGAISLSDNTINSCDPTALPVALMAFNAEMVDAGTATNLTWETSSESNSDYFLIERSVDGIQFESIGKRLAAGESDHLIAYNFSDESPILGTNYYRLQQVDQNGFTTISTVQMLTFMDMGNAMEVYPNPFSSSLVLQLDRMRNDAVYEWQLIDALGKQSKQMTLKDEVTTVDMTTVGPGIYFYRLSCNGIIIQSGRVIAAH